MTREKQDNAKALPQGPIQDNLMRFPFNSLTVARLSCLPIQL